MNPADIGVNRIHCDPSVVAQAREEAIRATEMHAKLQELEPQIQRQVAEQMLKAPPKFTVTARFDEQDRHTGHTYAGNPNDIKGERADKLRRDIYDRTPSPAHSDPEPDAYAALAELYPELMDYRSNVTTGLVK